MYFVDLNHAEELTTGAQQGVAYVNDVSDVAANLYLTSVVTRDNDSVAVIETGVLAGVTFMIFSVHVTVYLNLFVM